MLYKVFTVEYHGAPRNHQAIFVRDSEDVRGTIYHVPGDVLMGMSYERRANTKPDNSATYIEGGMVEIGTVEETDMARLEDICKTNPPQGAQVKLNGQRKDPSKPIRRCRDWLAEVVQQLVEEEILTKLESKSESGSTDCA